MLIYLEHRMKQEKVSREDIRKLLGVSEKTVRNKLSGRTDLTWNEARKIRRTFFPADDYEKLFELSKTKS